MLNKPSPMASATKSLARTPPQRLLPPPPMRISPNNRPFPMNEGLFIAIDHPAIACYDARKQIDWYCKTLGMRVVASDEKDPPSAVVGFDNSVRGGTMIELMPVRDQ